MSNENPNIPDEAAEIGAELASLFQKSQVRRFGEGQAQLADGVVEDPAISDWADGAAVDASRVTFPDMLSGEQAEQPDTQPSPSVGSAEGEGEPASVAGADPAGELPPPAGEAQEPPSQPSQLPPPEGYTWRYNDGTEEQTAQFSDHQVQEALRYFQWSTELPDETRAAMAMLVDGQAAAVPRAVYDQFVAWYNQQQAAPTPAPTTPNFDNLDLDPEVAAFLKQQQQQIEQLTRAQQTYTPPSQASTPDYVPANVQANLDASADQFHAAARAYAESHALTEPELETLVQSAVDSQVIETLSRNSAHWSPTGHMLAPPNIPQVAEQALDFALIRNPQLHAAVQQRRANPSAQAEPVVPDAVIQKRARAASHATAPSAAVAHTPRNVTHMTEMDRVNAMAAEIEAALRAS